MSKLLSSKKIIRVLEKHTFIFISQKGSHIKFRKIGKKNLTVIVPANKKEIPSGTVSSIIRQADLTRENFNI